MSFCLSEETLQAYLDGELTEGAARRAMAHLAECAGCARRIAEARQALSAISSKLDDHLLVNIPVERLRARFEDIVAEAVAEPVTRPSPISFSWRAAPAVASLLITVTMAVVVWLVLIAPKPEQVAIAPPQEKTTSANQPASREPETGQQPVNAPGRKDIGARRKSKSARLASSPRFAPIPEPPAPARGLREGAYFFDLETTMHMEKAQVLLRSFENASDPDAKELAYDKRVSRELLLRNILLRREAEASENAPAKSLLGLLEPLLLDIANLPAKPAAGDLASIKKRIRKSVVVVAMQIYSTPTASLD
jgi:hypothetical protein